MLALDLPREVEERLIAAASRAGQTKEAWAADAIIELLDDEEATASRSSAYAASVREFL